LRRALVVLAVLGAAGAATADYVTFGQGSGSKWDDPIHGRPAVITWGFVPDGTGMDPNFPLLPEVTGTSNVTALRNAIDAVHGAGAFDAALQRALHTWELVAGVTFQGPVADAGLPLGAAGATTPDLRIAAFAAVPGTGFEWVGAVGYGPPGNDLLFPDPVAGDIVFNLTNVFRIFPGTEGTPFDTWANDVEGLFLHELGHAAMGLGHPENGPAEVMYVGVGCCEEINRIPSPDDIKGAKVVYGPSSTPACRNGIDDDGDGLIDFPADPGCSNANWPIENPECNDGKDNDGDTKIDLADPECGGNASNRETSGCGLVGLEGLASLGLWRLAAKRRRRAAA